MRKFDTSVFHTRKLLKRDISRGRRSPKEKEKPISPFQPVLNSSLPWPYVSNRLSAALNRVPEPISLPSVYLSMKKIADDSNCDQPARTGMTESLSRTYIDVNPTKQTEEKLPVPLPARSVMVLKGSSIHTNSAAQRIGIDSSHSRIGTMLSSASWTNIQKRSVIRKELKSDDPISENGKSPVLTQNLTSFVDLLDLEKRDYRGFSYFQEQSIYCFRSKPLHKRRLKGKIPRSRSMTLSRNLSASKTAFSSSHVCVVPLRTRSLIQFSIHPIQSLSTMNLGQKMCKLRKVFLGQEKRPKTHTLIVLFEGVLGDVTFIDRVERSGRKFYLRPGTIEGLKVLENLFNIILVSALNPSTLYRVKDYLTMRKIMIHSVYRIDPFLSENWHAVKSAFAFQDYSIILRDLGFTDHSSSKVLLLTSALTEEPISEESLFQVLGTNVRINAKHLPVEFPGKNPLICVLVTDVALHTGEKATCFTSVVRDLIDFYHCTNTHNWEDAFNTSWYSASSQFQVFKTTKTHETYYSSLLPSIRPYQDPGALSKTKKWQESLYQEVPVSRIIALGNDGKVLNDCEQFDMEITNRQSTHWNLLESSMSTGINSGGIYQ